MDRITLIKTVENADAISERSVLLSALIACLSPMEACNALDVSFHQSFEIRRKILSKIYKDIQIEFTPFHQNLINQLLDLMDTLVGARRQSCAYTLKYLSEILPAEHTERIIEKLLLSKLISVRRRAYNLISKNWLDTYAPLIEMIWNRYRDIECALLIIRFFHDHEIKKKFTELNEVLKHDGKLLSRLYIRIGRDDRERLNNLARIDEISFVYVCTKLNIAISDNQAFEIFERHCYDKRLGLIIWCYGKLGLWSVLVRIYERLSDSDFQEKHLKIIYRS